MARFELHGGENIGDLALVPDLARDALAEGLPEVELEIEKGAGGYVDQLDRMSKQLDQGDTLVQVAPADLVLDDLIEQVDTLRRPLKEAERLIGEEKFQEALEKLRDILSQPGEHHEAIYLIAFCLFRLDRYEDSLATLSRLRNVRLGAHIRSQVTQLREQVRGRAVALLLVESLGLTTGGSAESSIERLRRLAELDPEFGMFHFLLAGNLMMADRLEEALKAADVGVRDADPEHRDQLRTLQREVESRLLEAKMDRARSLYRRGKYAKARSELDRVEARYRETPLWSVFRKYLEDLGGGFLRSGRKLTEVKPVGSFKDVDAFHFFLVRPEIQQSKGVIEMGMFEAASVLVDEALEHAPHFPYAHFLKALCLYQQVGESMGSDTPLGPTEAIELLEDALRHARLGAEDPDLGNAQDLVRGIEGGLEVMRTIQLELEIRQREAEKVNSVIQDYISARELVGEGITSPTHWRQVRESISGVGDRLREVRGEVTRPDAQGALDQLEEVVRGNLEALNSMEAQIEEAEGINAAIQEFDTIRTAAEKGATSKQILDRLTKLRRKVKPLGTRASTEGKKAIGELLKAIDSNLEHMEAMETHVAPLAAEFSSIMETAKSGISSESQAERVAQRLSELHKRITSKTRRIKNDSAKEALQQLKGAVERNQGQLEEILDAQKGGGLVGEFNALAEEFQSIVESAQSGARSRQELGDKLVDLAGRVVALSGKSKEKELTEATTKLMQAIGNVFSQIQNG